MAHVRGGYLERPIYIYFIWRLYIGVLEDGKSSNSGKSCNDSKSGKSSKCMVKVYSSKSSNDSKSGKSTNGCGVPSTARIALLWGSRPTRCVYIQSV